MPVAKYVVSKLRSLPIQSKPLSTYCASVNLQSNMESNKEGNSSHLTDIKLSPMHLEEIEESVSSEEQLKLWQAVRKYPKVAGYCLALTSAILLWGYGKSRLEVEY